ncbi:MAG TPA: ATP synthase F1 subunit gamma [Myxococcota bacterium]|nr:ATP synthase F1 subunit gamma [Myxococcota bacterium]
MARIREIRSRVVAIKKTQKITSAMKMISAARLARAQQAAEASRPYGRKLVEVFTSVARGLDADAHPLLVRRNQGHRKLDVVLVTSDRGLCGAFNANLIKTAQAILGARRSEFAQMSLICIGRRGRDYARRRRLDVAREWTGISVPTADHAREIGQYLVERFLAGESDEVVFVYSRFVSSMRQDPTVQTLLPVVEAVSDPGGTPLPYEIEPDPESLLAALLPRVVEFAVLRALLENSASEHGARMTAMESATENTRELIRSLTLDMNKARQTQITTELIEIVAGAEAL